MAGKAVMAASIAAIEESTDALEGVTEALSRLQSIGKTQDGFKAVPVALCPV